MTFENKGLEKNTASVAFGFGTSGFHSGGRAEGDRGEDAGFEWTVHSGTCAFQVLSGRRGRRYRRGGCRDAQQRFALSGAAQILGVSRET